MCKEDDDTCVECLTDADCNDVNLCTTDTCNLGNNTCDNPPVVNGMDCEDGSWCNGAETCTDGICEAETERCPGQSCDETTHQCVMLTATITAPEDQTTSNHGEIIAFGAPKNVLQTEIVNQAYQSDVEVIFHPKTNTPIILNKILRD